MKNVILDKLFRSPMINDMIWNITGGNELGEELKMELFLILLEMPDHKIINAWKNHWLNYLCINILQKQWKSKTSPFYKKFRKFGQSSEPINDVIEIADDFDYELLGKIINIVETKLPLVERELFLMRYKVGKYDRWFGELGDKECGKSVYSYRKIENKLAIQTINDKKPITIDHSTIEKYHKRSILKIKKLLKDDDTE